MLIPPLPWLHLTQLKYRRNVSCDIAPVTIKLTASYRLHAVKCYKSYLNKTHSPWFPVLQSARINNKDINVIIRVSLYQYLLLSTFCSLFNNSRADFPRRREGGDLLAKNHFILVH